MVTDLDDFDFDDLNTLKSGQIAIFILATYGEGEPTDNAMAFNQFLKGKTRRASLQPAEQIAMQLRYAAFGLGNSSYQFYNSMIRQTDRTLQSAGAIRIGDLGLGDDGKGTLEDDFVEWKDTTLAAIAQHFHLPKLEYTFKPNFEVTESDIAQTSDVFLGEPNKSHLRNKIRGPFTPQNPFPATIVKAEELFNSNDRNCVHIEFDIGGTTLTYDTGDHLAVWPVNSDMEVDRFLRVFGLYERKSVVVDIISHDLTVKVPIPAKTTYEAAARYYLDIGAPLSRHILGVLASFAKSESIRSKLVRLSSEREVFQREVEDKRLNLAQTLSTIAPHGSFESVPFSFILENVAKLQPRYYSISSSSLLSKNRISITAVVDSVKSSTGQLDFKGVNTNYLLALKFNCLPAPSDAPADALRSVPAAPHTHKINGPRGLFSQPTALIHEYAKSFSNGIFSLHSAFSREQEDKRVYVQDLVLDHAAELSDLVLRRNAQVYVCGDASRMAKDIFRTFAHIINDDCEKDFNETGDSYLRSMKAGGRWSEDVW
ncbi:NADPH-cytochrome P450 reductase [Coniosporium tulheliwenetii]|uniref:NADPH-cytochrome P450 reductase n=1 Tax=Coniosporium tulheliwenetii TaxID=3383036 RepID=A0ACC2YJQ2_9PEZI|nr:NADPH-cytochrome P450 reductase [Cladosporium sp. JES 115]